MSMESVMGMMQSILSSLGMGPMPDRETQEALRAANHNNHRVHKAWDMYMTLISNGEPAGTAMRKVEEAISLWQEYEDKHWIDPPIPEPPTPSALPAFPPGFPGVGIPMPVAVPAGVQGVFVIVNCATRKAVESEPGIIAVFESADMAIDRARMLPELHEIIACIPQFSHHVCLNQVDAEFTEPGE